MTNVLCVNLANKNIKMSSFMISENFQRKEGWPDRSVSDNQSSIVKSALRNKTSSDWCI